ncbi:hypothetical protein ASG76_06790 [Nocardioides sp. Soil774]|uniref:hypothetical protein n=1 Tax=Nocardioides sp. Soil774 TaxID=1736408 RepID=UPI0006F64DF0|nr:hypothetical protein [Nocardioides sp. Soil774]KRE95358.1 hypothetical protein ASG76_06790 [Nocardioides sp. Soil774]
MGSVILISTAAIIVAIVGCFVIWRLDASRAEEIEHQTAPAPRPQLSVVPAPAPQPRPQLVVVPTQTPPRHLGA